MIILLAVWFLSLTTQKSKFLPQEVQVNLFYSFGCYLMSLMLLNVFVLRKFLWFFEINFLNFFSEPFAYLSKYRSTFPPYRKQSNFVVDCFKRRFSCFRYYEFSDIIFEFLFIIAHFCCCFCFFCSNGQIIQQSNWTNFYNNWSWTYFLFS